MPKDQIVKTFINPSILLLACLCFSMFPDGDSAVGVLFQDFGRFHNQWSHSLFFGIIPSILITLGMLFIRPRAAPAWGLLCLISCMFHVLFDYFCYGRGVMLFWPFTSQRFISPVLIFYGVHWSDGFFSAQHIETVVSELLFLLIFLPPIIYLTRRDLPQQTRNQT